MAITNFIPEIWSSMLLSSLKKSTVFAQPGIVNRNYEGNIAQAGDTVKITSISRPTIGNYTANSTTITPETLTDAQRTLLIDQSKYFAFEVDDIDAAQAAGGVLEEGLVEAGYGLRDVADQLIAGFYSGVASANAIGTKSVTSAALANQYLTELMVKLDEANVPEEGRWVILPPWYVGLLVQGKFAEADSGGAIGAEGLRTGQVKTAYGFSVFKSNNVVNTTGDDYAVMAGYSGAITYAEQIAKVEAYRPENSFSDAVKGLHLYGAKLIRPDGIATLIASKT